MPPIYNALIRTHHITSAKKISKLRAAASKHSVYALLRSHGRPGVMYCQGCSESQVQEWTSTVQRLRYKDFQFARRAGLVERDDGGGKGEVSCEVQYGRLEEVGTVKEFGARMLGLGVWRWWRKGMGYAREDEVSCEDKQARGVS